MGLKVGELFVELGVKGSEKSVARVGSLNKGLKQTASDGLAAKAALIGAVYAFQRLMQASGERGTGLANFTATVGTSAKTLQQYQYAARQVGVSNEEVEGSFKSLQAAMMKTLMNGDAPAGMRNVAELTGGISTEDIDRFAKAPELLIQRLQEYAGKERNVGLRNEVLKSFGIGDGMLAGLSRQAFRPEVMAKAPTYSDGEIKSLDRANIAWSNLGNKVEMAFGHFNAAHGGQLVNDLSKITDQIVIMANAFMKLAEKTNLFKGISMIFEGWGKIFEGISAAVDAINELKAVEAPKDDDDKGEGFWASAGRAGKTTLSWESAVVGMLGDAMEGILGSSESTVTPEQKKQYEETLRKLRGGKDGPVGEGRAPAPRGGKTAAFHATAPGAAAPRVPAAMPAGAAAPAEVNVTQTLNFLHDGKDAKKTGDSTKQAVKDAFWSNPALTGY